MKKWMNVLCVLILALTLLYLVSNFCFSGREVSISVDPKSVSFETALILLFVMLAVLAAIALSFIYFIRFILNVNRNEVFTPKNISLLRKYGVCALVCGVCVIILSVTMGIEPGVAVGDSLDALGEGFFALLMGEVFGIGQELKEARKGA